MQRLFKVTRKNGHDEIAIVAKVLLQEIAMALCFVALAATAIYLFTQP